MTLRAEVLHAVEALVSERRYTPTGKERLTVQAASPTQVRARVNATRGVAGDDAPAPAVRRALHALADRGRIVREGKGYTTASEVQRVQRAETSKVTRVPLTSLRKNYVWRGGQAG